MNKLALNNPLFIRLRENPPDWWTALKTDKDLSVQVRKDNYLDIYFNGGNIIRGLSYDGSGFSGEIHYKYIPVTGGNGNYVSFDFSSGLSFGEVKAIELKNFSKETLGQIKSNIKNYYPPQSEKGIQYSFIKNDPHFLDSEFQYFDPKQKKVIRIDLVRVDPSIKKLVFVEVKTMGDSRLYTSEIVGQLSAYNSFITGHGASLLSYYKKVIMIKRALGILPDGLVDLDIAEYGLLDKTLLLFGDCEQNWIDRNAPDLDSKIKEHAVGCYYFGAPKYSCDIIPATKANRHIFNK